MARSVCLQIMQARYARKLGRELHKLDRWCGSNRRQKRLWRVLEVPARQGWTSASGDGLGLAARGRSSALLWQDAGDADERKTDGAGAGGGCQVADSVYFDTIKVAVPDAAAVCHKAVAAGMNLRQLDAKTVTVSLDETTEPADVEALLKVFGVASPDVAALASKVAIIPLAPFPVSPPLVSCLRVHLHVMCRVVSRCGFG